MMTYVAVSELTAASALAAELPEFRSPTEIDLADHVLLNTSKIGSLTAIIGLNREPNYGVLTGESSSEQVEVVGADKNGALMAGAARTIHARLGGAMISPQKDSDQKRPDLELKINMAEIRQNLGEQKAELRDPKAWASFIDRSLRAGLREAAWQHLVRNASLLQQYVTPVAFTLNEVFLAANDSLGQLDGQLSNFAFAAIINTLIYPLDAFLERDNLSSGNVYSILPLHVDRLAAVALRTRFGAPLAKAA